MQQLVVGVPECTLLRSCRMYIRAPFIAVWTLPSPESQAAAYSSSCEDNAAAVNDATIYHV